MDIKKLLKKTFSHEIIEVFVIIISYGLLFEFVVAPLLTYALTILNVIGFFIGLFMLLFLFIYIKHKLELWDNKKAGTKKNYEKEKKN